MKRFNTMENPSHFNMYMVLLLISVISFSPDSLTAKQDRWKFIGKSGTATSWYIDTETISYPSKNIVSVWVRSIPDKNDTDHTEGHAATEKILKDIQTKYFGEYEYTESLLEIDCSKNMFRLLHFVAYNKDRDIITSSISPDAEWSFIIPGSIGETVHYTVCIIK